MLNTCSCKNQRLEYGLEYDYVTGSLYESYVQKRDRASRTTSQQDELSVAAVTFGPKKVSAGIPGRHFGLAGEGVAAGNAGRHFGPKWCALILAGSS